jgi:hypothetical protein
VQVLQVLQVLQVFCGQRDLEVMDEKFEGAGMEAESL